MFCAAATTLHLKQDEVATSTIKYRSSLSCASAYQRNSTRTHYKASAVSKRPHSAIIQLNDF